MANVNCSSCAELREVAPTLGVEGLNDTMVASLQNNTGLNPSSGNDDCTDLNNLNDCLVGNMASEIDAYEVCDWKTYMKKFVPNVWTTLKGIIASICGLWTNVDRLNCQIGALSGEFSILIDGLTEATLGQGVEWRTSGTGHDELPTMRGNAYVLRINGSLHFTGSKWLNFTGNTDDGNWLVYRYKINKEQYGIKNMWSNILMSNNAAHITGYAQVYGAGETTPGYWGWDDPNGAETVPAGYYYVDIRVSNIASWGIASGTGNVTLTGVVPILTTHTAECQ